MTNPFTHVAYSEERVANFVLPDLCVVPAGKSTSPVTTTTTVEEHANPADSRIRQPDRTPEYFVPRALAKRWGVCVDKVLNFIRSGELRAFNVAAKSSKRPRYRIPVESVRQFEEQTRAAAIPEAPAPPAPSRRRKRDSVTPARRTYF